MTKSTRARYTPEYKLEALQQEDGEEYGWPRIWNELPARGIRAGRDRVLPFERTRRAAQEKRAAQCGRSWGAIPRDKVSTPGCPSCHERCGPQATWPKAHPMNSAEAGFASGMFLFLENFPSI